MRVTRRRRGPKTYRSVQLVQSYRREDGMPANKVLASFGNLSELETENLKLAVKASREGCSVVLRAEAQASSTAAPKVRRNLAFLDVATCLRTWQRWGLTELLDELAPSSKREVSLGDVVGALVVQRCVAPASKLEASRWYQTTALPELLGVSSRRFNNTRIHRALETLDAIEHPLQQKLACRVERQQGQFVSLFLDCTDTWFVGRGPELAKKRTTKEGLTRRRIGIALMCNEDGFPLRWATVSGDFNESKTMLDMVDEVSSLSWADRLPLVVDRAMGRGVTVEALLARDVHFITAVPSPEIAKHSALIPVGRFDDIDVSDDAKHVRKKLEARALEAGFVLSGERYVFDLGLFTKGEGGKEKPASWLAPSRAVASLRLARRVRVERDRGKTRAELAEHFGSKEGVLRLALVLCGLTDELQRRVLAGEADRITPATLRGIAELPTAAQQRAAFDEARRLAGEGPALKVTRELARLCNVPDVKLRGAVVFSPAVFINTRRALADAISELERAIDKANEQLCSHRRHASRERAIARVGEVLKRYRLRDVYQVVCEEQTKDGKTLHQLRLERDEETWARKRALDGFSLIIAHPEVALTADELIARYFAKDKVEKDFQAIKSVLELRPVNHQTDPKVRAHVTLCVLALLLERAIEHQLRAAGLAMTGPYAVHLLKTAKLNLYAGAVPIYSATEPDPEQKRILAALRLEDLTDDELLAESLTPRA